MGEAALVGRNGGAALMCFFGGPHWWCRVGGLVSGRIGVPH